MDLDTKWKSVRESRGFKALCVVLSMVLAFSSVALLSAVMRVSGLYNEDAFTDPSVAKKGSLVQTTIFKAELDVIVNEIALLAGQKQLQQKAAALKKAKADSVAAALEQYKKDQATAIRKTLVFYAGLKNQNITNIGKDIPNYKVPAKTIKKVVAEDRDAPGLIRDLQQIVNGTRAGEDYLPYLQLANWLRSSDGVEYYNDSDMQDDPEDLTDYYTVDFTVDGKTVSADMYDDDLTLGDTVKSAETHIKKLYDKAVVKPYQTAADEQQDMRQNLQELQCLQFYAKDNITGQEVSQLAEGQTPAMLKNAPVLILDEATAFADPDNETRVQAAFKELAKGRTTLIIAHRLSTIRSASRILVIDGNGIQEEGTHEELMAKGGEYAQLYLAQKSVSV